MQIVTMRDIDAARAKAVEVLDELRGMPAKGSLTCHILEVRAYYDYCMEQVGTLITKYHQQRSSENLLRLLRHMRTSCLPVGTIGCEECQDIAALLWAPA